MSTNGTHPPALRQRRVLVVGGKERNIPIWARTAFDIELVDQNTGAGKGKGKLSSHVTGRPPEAIVICTKFVSHNFAGQAHDMGADLDVPVLKARDGWSTAVAEAARIGTEWFVDAVQRAGRGLTIHQPDKAQEALEVVDNAWKALAHAAEDQADREREKAAAAAKRMVKVQARLDKVEAAHERLRSGAADRVMAEIKRRSKEMQRSNGSALTDEVKEQIGGVIAQFDRAYLAARAQLTAVEKRLAEIEPDDGE